jgi:hypothetical protein
VQQMTAPIIASVRLEAAMKPSQQAGSVGFRNRSHLIVPARVRTGIDHARDTFLVDRRGTVHNSNLLQTLVPHHAFDYARLGYRYLYAKMYLPMTEKSWVGSTLDWDSCESKTKLLPFAS